MKTAIIPLMVLSAAGVGALALMDGEALGTPRVQVQQESEGRADADELYDLVKQARAELREMRVSAGLSAYPARAQAGEPEGHERAEGSEEGGAYLPKMAKQNDLFPNGARLALQFNPDTQVFVGSVTNTTAETLAQVRVEIHLDNGTELGPTKRVDVEPGQTIPVELGAFGNRFSSWVSHPEAGVEQGHGAGGEESVEGRSGQGDPEARGEHSGEARGEHGGEAADAEGADAGEQRGDGTGDTGVRPGDPVYRPLYNQLRILRGEMHAFQAELKLGRTNP